MSPSAEKREQSGAGIWLAIKMPPGDMLNPNRVQGFSPDTTCGTRLLLIGTLGSAPR